MFVTPDFRNSYKNSTYNNNNNNNNNNNIIIIDASYSKKQ